MNRHYAKTKRQFNYLVKRVTQLMDTEKWEELSENQKQKIVNRFNRLYNKLKTVFNAQSLVKAMGATAFVLGMGINANAQSFKAEVLNPFNLSTIPNINIPSFADIDDDGDLDYFGILQTPSYEVKVAFQENTGTSTAPFFGATQLNPFSITTDSVGFKNVFVDIDNDGDLDMFSGGYYGNIFYHENKGTKTAPLFGTMITNPFSLSFSGELAMLGFADLDDDGDQDLMVGSYYGNFYYFKNTGSKSAPSFAAEQKNPFGIVVPATGQFSAPEFSDVDGDGDLDMMTGDYYGDFIYYKNTGTKSSPTFAPSVTNPFGLTNLVNGYSFMAFADLDNDGDDDILAGEYYGNHHYFENSSSIGVPEFTLNAEVNLFPNPTNTFVNIALSEPYNNVSIEVTSVNGQIVLERKFVTSNNIQLNVSKLESGIYFVKISTEHKTGLKKLVID